MSDKTWQLIAKVVNVAAALVYVAYLDLTEGMEK
jgi:hypothetical protein